MFAPDPNLGSYNDAADAQKASDDVQANTKPD